MNKLSELINDDIETVGIAGHVRPDGDCVGSVLGMAEYLRKNFRLTVDTYLEPIPDMFKFLKGADQLIEEVKDKKKVYDLFISLDCAECHRLGDAALLLKAAKKSLCIDHHQSNSGFADINDIRPHDSSTCEIIYTWMDRELITKDIAECLYCGMVTDTGVFQYSCTHSSTMTAAGDLMDMGINYPWIVNRIFFEKSIEQQKILGIALEKAVLSSDGRIIYTILTLDDMKRANAKAKHLEGIASSLRSTKGVNVSIMIQQTGDMTYKLSLRSDESCDVAVICEKYGGGGHNRAAGATLNIPPEKAVEELTGYIREAFEKKT